MNAIGFGHCPVCKGCIAIYWPRKGMPRVFRHGVPRVERAKCDGSYKEAVCPHDLDHNEITKGRS